MMQILKESVQNMQEYKNPPCAVDKNNKIGGGGNGKVGFVLGHEDELVIKIFSVSKNLDSEKRNRRYERFCREIVMQQQLSAEIEGILPILDFSFPEKFSKNQCAWYTMPRAEKFFVRDGIPLIAKLQKMYDLAKILKELHRKGMAHRDLKPDNLLIYRGRIFLADYGLLWVAGENTITPPTESLGPIKIMPPELEEREGLRQCDYPKSDVYLFAKVVWMYVNENDFGYRGEYSRKDPQRCLRIKTNYGKTIEPLHLMMEKCSKHNWSERPSIEDCMELIEHQIMILRGEFPQQKEREYTIKEQLASYRINVNPDAEVYESGVKVFAFLRDMIQVMDVKIVIAEMGRMRLINPYSVRVLQDNFFAFSEEVTEGQIKKSAMQIHRIEISEDKIVAILGNISEEQKINAGSSGIEVISGSYEAEIILK